MGEGDKKGGAEDRGDTGASRFAGDMSGSARGIGGLRNLV